MASAAFLSNVSKACTSLCNCSSLSRFADLCWKSKLCKVRSICFDDVLDSTVLPCKSLICLPKLLRSCSKRLRCFLERLVSFNLRLIAFSFFIDFSIVVLITLVSARAVLRCLTLVGSTLLLALRCLMLIKRARSASYFSFLSGNLASNASNLSLIAFTSAVNLTSSVAYSLRACTLESLVLNSLMAVISSFLADSISAVLMPDSLAFSAFWLVSRVSR